MLVKLLLIIILIMISLFCWLSLTNPLDVKFQFFGKVFPTDLSTLMITSFVLGAMLVFISTLTRDAKRAIQNYRQTRQRKKEQSIQEELNKGMDYFLRGDLAKSKTHFAEVLRNNPLQKDLYLKLSEISVKEGNDEEALNWLERARWIDTKKVDILLRQAEIYQRMKRFDEAIRTLNRAIGLDESNLKALNSLRDIYQNSRRLEEAIRIQKSILKLAKGKQAEEGENLFYLGLKYEYAKDLLNRGGEEDLENALKGAKEIVREEKTFQPGFVLLGDIYLRMGKWASAGKVWGKSFRRFKSITFILRLEELYLSREDPSTLLRIYQKTLSADPENWMIAFFYAKFCLRLEMLDEALEEINMISLRQKDFPALHRLLAEIYLHKKDFSRAAQEFEKTFELSGTSYLPFTCNICEKESKEWMAYCPKCHRWSTYSIKEVEKIISPLPPSRPYSDRAYFSPEGE
ncbi:MAG: tetratricopeptide repeat protein [Thermodesulfobacteriota bacterium]|nr:tetratricopeptide repeat protein [Thermodesulfobacteriota bacterium]